VPIAVPTSHERNEMMVILPLLSGLAGAVIGAGGIIVSQIIANKHARLENDKQRATEQLYGLQSWQRLEALSIQLSQRQITITLQ
jgi:hypothetical protein